MNIENTIREIKDQISILSFLKNLGHKPVKQIGKEHYFKSIFRNEHTDSLVVNEELEVWFDRGGRNASGIRGGTIIDIALAYWYPVSLEIAIQKIKETMADITLKKVKSRHRKKLPVLNRRYVIREIKEITRNPSIFSFLLCRGVWTVADECLKEIHYQVAGLAQSNKSFYAAGWQNENGGWEIRNKYFKGCLGTRGLTFIASNSSRLLLFEDYFDYLTWRFYHEDEPADIIVLNSLSLLGAAIKRCKAYAEIEIYFSNDVSGKEASLKVTGIYPSAKDCSLEYRGYNNYNEMLMSSIKKITGGGFNLNRL
ncbi:hypothetical protein [Pedobacter aquatilis]|uniref:hypothetical protein n=1 Tax=Pedobacter aquatilis TaxID=351343 RepID=UPI00292EE6F2|nr:hypothetical protein [Pedobacter aquatilis]